MNEVQMSAFRQLLKTLNSYEQLMAAMNVIMLIESLSERSELFSVCRDAESRMKIQLKAQTSS